VKVRALVVGQGRLQVSRDHASDSAFSRNRAVYDTTIGWRFINPLMQAQYGVDSIPETAENVASDFEIERQAQAGPHGPQQPDARRGRHRSRPLGARDLPCHPAAKEGRSGAVQHSIRMRKPTPFTFAGI